MVWGVSEGPWVRYSWCRETPVSQTTERLIAVVFPVWRGMKYWLNLYQIIVYLIMSERSERNFFLNAYGKSFWHFNRARICPARQSGFCKLDNYETTRQLRDISTTTRVIILKYKLKDAQYSLLRFIKFVLRNRPNLPGMKSIQAGKII